MELGSIIALVAAICVGLAFLLPRKKEKLPPGPRVVPLIGNLSWLSKSFYGIAPMLKQIWAEHGPIVTVNIGPRRVVFVCDRVLTHEALVHQGAAFADRPSATAAFRILSSNQHSINSAGYGPLWRLLRRNMTSEIFNPSRVKTFARGREWILGLMVEKLRSESESGGSVAVMESFRYAMFCLLLLMCFGQMLDEMLVRDIEDAHRRLLLGFTRFNVFAAFPRFGKLVFRDRWEELHAIRRRQEELLLPLIRAREELKEKGELNAGKHFEICYVDTLLGLELAHDGGRKLTDGEMVSLCSEFLNAGTDTTSTTLQWIMANVVKYPEIQEKLLEEIEAVVSKRSSERGGRNPDIITEEELQEMEYPRAVVLETLRRHPPGHFLLPHAVKEEVEIDGYVLPKGTMVNFEVAELGWDGKVWEDPMKFKPERFLSKKNFDLSSNREILMMPFGAGRRICPGMGVAMLHLEYFLTNLVKEFQWKVKEGEEVDLSEKQEFTVVMKNPLKVVLTPRRMLP